MRGLFTKEEEKEFTAALSAIIGLGREYDAIRILAKSMEEERDRLLDARAELTEELRKEQKANRNGAEKGITEIALGSAR